MQCPSCRRNVPTSFKCKECGADLVRRSAPASASFRTRPNVAAVRPDRNRAATGAPAVNPYASPAQADEPPVPASRPVGILADRESQPSLAGRGARLAAQCLDGLLGLLCVAPGLVLVMLASPDSSSGAASAASAASTAVVLLGGVLLLGGLIGLLVYQIRLLSSEGQTWGKKKMNIRIVLHETGEIPGLGKSLGLRLFVNNLIGSIPCIGAVYGIADPLFIFGEERRCLHDRIAGTKVVEAV